MESRCYVREMHCWSFYDLSHKNTPTAINLIKKAPKWKWNIPRLFIRKSGKKNVKILLLSKECEIKEKKTPKIRWEDGKPTNEEEREKNPISLRKSHFPPSSSHQLAFLPPNFYERNKIVWCVMCMIGISSLPRRNGEIQFYELLHSRIVDVYELSLSLLLLTHDDGYVLHRLISHLIRK